MTSSRSDDTFFPTIKKREATAREFPGFPKEEWMMYKKISRSLILISALFLVTSIEVSAQNLRFFDDEDLLNAA